jgi:acyl-CoA dehydrogenase
MNFSHSDKVRDLQQRVSAFMETYVYPAESAYQQEIAKNRRAGNPWLATEVVEELKVRAQAANLWNLFLPDSEHGAGLTNLEYAPAVRDHGPFAASAPRRSIAPRRTPATWRCWLATARPQQKRWLEPLLDGPNSLRLCDDRTRGRLERCHEHRSPAIVRDGDHYVINGRKWWTSGAGDPRCEILIFMGKTNPGAVRHAQQSMILVPMNTPASRSAAATLGVRLRPCAARPRGNRVRDVRVPAENLLLGEGRGFEIAQGRSGRGASIIACGSSASPSARSKCCAGALCRASLSGATLGTGRHARAHRRIADLIDQARWLVLNAAYMMDTVGNRAAKKEIAMIKVAAPAMACEVIDWAIQVHGGGGVSEDFRWRKPTRVRALCVSPTDRTRCTATDRQARAVTVPLKKNSHDVGPALQILAGPFAMHTPDRAGDQFILQRRGVGAPLSGQAVPGLLRHADQLRRIARRSANRGLPRAALRCAQGRSRAAAHAEQPAIRDRYYGILRANAVVVPLNPMNLTQEILRYAEDAGERPSSCRRSCTRASKPLLGGPNLKHVIVAAYSDYLKSRRTLAVP